MPVPSLHQFIQTCHISSLTYYTTYYIELFFEHISNLYLHVDFCQFRNAIVVIRTCLIHILTCHIHFKHTLTLNFHVDFCQFTNTIVVIRTCHIYFDMTHILTTFMLTCQFGNAMLCWIIIQHVELCKTDKTSISYCIM